LKHEQNKLSESIDKIITKVVYDLNDKSIIGLGSGSTVETFTKKLGIRIQEENLSIQVIPSSLQIQLAAENALLNIISPNLIPEIDITVDGADQIDENFNMIKGGGGALFRELILLRAAEKSIILADETKYVTQLSMPIPIETTYYARSLVYKNLTNIGGKPKLRLLKKGYPYISENGNIIFDTDFGIIRDPDHTRSQITNIAGIIEAGIFIAESDFFYRANLDGSVKIFEMH
jgi:ribose 5-phosphate isomerase A